MQWHTENWLWIVLPIGVFLLMRRTGMGCGMGHMRHEGHGGAGPSDTDPVNGERLDPEKAFKTTYQGRPYYFASTENQRKFEASPDSYVRHGDGHGDGHRHHGHSC